MINLPSITFRCFCIEDFSACHMGIFSLQPKCHEHFWVLFKIFLDICMTVNSNHGFYHLKIKCKKYNCLVESQIFLSYEIESQI